MKPSSLLVRFFKEAFEKPEETAFLFKDVGSRRDF